MLARTAGHEGARFNVARHSDRTAPVAPPPSELPTKIQGGLATALCL